MSIKNAYLYAKAIAVACDLKSEGENPEYDRALAEFIGDFFGRDHDQVAIDIEEGC